MVDEQGANFFHGDSQLDQQICAILCLFVVVIPVVVVQLGMSPKQHAYHLRFVFDYYERGPRGTVGSAL